MKLTPDAARAFINNYKKLLLEVAGAKPGSDVGNERLAEARSKLVADPALAAQAMVRLRARGDALDADFAEGLGTLRVQRWIYLRDTRAHSIFIDAESDDPMAYGVLGLTQRLKDVVGESGAFIETGLMAFRGSIVCDGLLAVAAWLGPNYRRSFNALLDELRANGQLRSDALGPPPRLPLAGQVGATAVENAKPKAKTRETKAGAAATPGALSVARAAPAAAVRRKAPRQPRQDAAREHRIDMEAVVDCYHEVERAMGWFYYLEGRMPVPFEASCTLRRAISPLKVGQVVRVRGMALEEECEADMFVRIDHGDDELAVPLAQLTPLDTADAATSEAVADWHYWCARGYRF